MATIELEDLTEDFLELHANHSREDLLLKIKRLQTRNNNQVDMIESLRSTEVSNATFIDELTETLDAVIDVSNYQDEVLQHVAEWMDEHLECEAPTGSRKRSVQLAVEVLAERLDGIDATDKLRAILDADV